MDSRRDPCAVLALAVAGALCGHELGYLIGSGTHTGHAYFGWLTPLALSGVVTAMWVKAVSIIRRSGEGAPHVASLAAAQSGLYLVFEIGERTVGSADGDLFSVPVVLGLVAQPLVAWLAVHALTMAAVAIAALLGPARPATTRDGVWRAGAAVPFDTTTHDAVPARAPPSRF